MARTPAKSAPSDPAKAQIRAFKDSKAWEDGRWEAAYDSSRTATVPADFDRELKKSPRAGAFFKTISAANRYAILWRLQTAKKAETREKRIRTFIGMLEKGETIH